MPRFEYKVVPAPARGEKAKGVRSPEARFAYALETLMNTLAAEGWEYQRADMLPSEERQGLTGTTTQWRNMLVFRRAAVELQPITAVTDALSADVSEGTPDEAATLIPEPVAPPPLRPASGAERMLKDNGVEELSDVSGMTAALRARAKAGQATDSAKS